MLETMKQNYKKYIAEAFGTFVLVFFACGVAAFTGGSAVATSLAFGLVIVAMAFTIGGISGCNINPAVSIAMFFMKKLSLPDFIGYVSAQVVGALVGSGLLSAFMRSTEFLGGNQIQPILMENFKLDAWSYIGAFLVEVILTFVFVIVIIAVTDEKREKNSFAGIIIGLTLTLVHLLGLNFTGTSVNPARSLAPAIFQAFAKNTTSLEQIWIWIIAPLVGGVIAAIAYTAISSKKNA